ncbi:hypothetical protein GCM10010218_56320 [Streptomyces mashuensis]|uniref:Patatin-like phospholipase n=1 Tax=Streptomyces mashuensis TaxID=33904 RepID=A0A919EFS8_9ACTN|nr:patatin-like phospholipase family protein [Streptomyces mashuensis]GHF67572.1 hypothetical protein GCM10010218_56320 [Streptomyces mashuensis]
MVPGRTLRRPGAGRAALLAVACVLPLLAGALWFLLHAPAVDHIGLQLAGTAKAAHHVTGDRTGAHLRALADDHAVTAGYTLTLAGIFLLGRHTVAHHARQRHVAVQGVVAAVAAGAFDTAENLLLRHGLTHPAAGDAPFAAATACATVKWTLLALTVPPAAVLLGVVLNRAVRHLMLRRGGSPAGPPDGPPDVVPPWPVVNHDGDRWPPDSRPDPPGPGPARWLNGSRVPPGREQGALGFCVSGGGIRSACVALGALQALRPHLLRARYLVAVSGGAYTAGAFQLALTGSADGRIPPPAGGSADVFRPGSPEEDHLRRHSKYIAEGTGQWLTALGVLLRGLLASLGILTAALVVLGIALGQAYHHVPVTDLSHLTHPSATGHILPLTGPPPPYPAPRTAALLTVPALLLAAAACWLVWLAACCLSSRDGVRTAAITAFRACVVTALAVAVVVLVVPAVAWAAVRLLTGLQATGPQTGLGLGLTTLLTYVTVLVSTLWRSRRTVGRGLRRLRKAGNAPQVTQLVPHGLTPHLLVWAVLVLLAAVCLVILGWATATAPTWPAAWQIAVPAVLLPLAVGLDQTWMSLHPFYRGRLASAFAVRRTTTPDGEQIAVPYDFATEPTPLDAYGRRHEGFPQVILAAAANLSGSDRTPPGRRAVSFTLSHDYVGGPDVGYVRTAGLRRRTRRIIDRDLTVQSAVAVSGAAFASAMGRMARPYQMLFALTNARLGTWLPNPATLQDLWSTDPAWSLRPQPALRRLPYLLREVFGRYPLDGRLLLTTDGGHYENLGLVELLRHGVRTAVCIDASGDRPPLAGTLAEAIALAREELGVEVVLDDWERLVPGSARPLHPEDPLAGLNGRLSARVVVTGTILYPRDLVDEAGRPCGRRGRLVVAKAALTHDLPYPLLARAQGEPVFPRDSTSDQWFDHRQFDSYLGLGRFIGEQADKALQTLHTPPEEGPA